MSKIEEQTKEQKKWNQKGLERQKEIEQNPHNYIISICPLYNRSFYDTLMELIDPIQDKQILEVGFGRGDFSVWLAKQGAKITAVDIGTNLVTAADALSRLNKVKCEFRQGDITALPFADSKYDIVIGIAILHHLSESDVLKALHECHRVLKANGLAIFYEPVENSKLFNFVQNLFPAGKKGSSNYRPSILQRKAWLNYVKSSEDRVMTSKELILAGAYVFSTTRISPFGFLIRLIRLNDRFNNNTLVALDKFLFKVLPPLKYFSQTVLVEYRK